MMLNIYISAFSVRSILGRQGTLIGYDIATNI